MDIQTILEYLNAVPVRATYGAVGDLLGVRPQAVPRLLGAQRPEASWIVNGSTGEPTGYAPGQVDPRLPGTHIIRTGNELRQCLESEPTPAPDSVSVPAVNELTGREIPESELLALSSDARWIIGTLVPVFLLVAGLLAAQIASVSRGLNTRIEEVNGRIDDLGEQLSGVDARIDDVRTELQEEIAVLRSAAGSIADRLSAVEPATDPSVVPELDEGGQALESAAPETSPAAPETSPDAPAEPAADPDAPVVAPAPPPE